MRILFLIYIFTQTIIFILGFNMKRNIILVPGLGGSVKWSTNTY